VPVLTGPLDELNLAVDRANGVDALVWEIYDTESDGSNVYLRKGSRPRIKLNKTGYAFAPDIEAPFVIYWQNGDLKLYRMDKGKHVALPARINTRAWERGPSISDKWIMFERERAADQRILLYNRKTGAMRVIAILRGDWPLELNSGEVNGNWAVWQRCISTCVVVRYNIATRTKTFAWSAAGSLGLFSPSVTGKGVVYAVRSEDTELARYGGPGDPGTGTPILTLPSSAISGTFARSKPDGSVDVYYSRNDYVDDRTDVYRINDPAPAR
jgi:hypothetical protein